MARPARDEATIERQLASLDDLPSDRAERAAALTAAIASKHYRIVAKGARLAADALVYDLVPALRAAYPRFLEKLPKNDPSCFAKKAIVRALVALEHDDAEFYLAGLALKQREPVWGGTTDTAADVRASSAMGLVASGYPRALVAVATLLYDPEPDARLGAVRAAAYGTPREAELLLRSKVLAGDGQAAIVGECFAALMAVAPDESLAFVAAYLAHPDDALRELAALALGESRVPGALDPLKEAWNGLVVGDSVRSALISAAAAHRSEPAFDWLLGIAAEARAPIAEQVIESLATYRLNARLAERLARVLEQRGDRALAKTFEKLWAR